ncbi:MAG: rod shape-determining protein MreC [Clostridia bacterium]|nr:rod shape-determining protein MreC [Clostridia bacterium]
MKKFGKKHIIIFSCVALAVLCVAAFSFKTGNSAISNAIGTVISPVQKATSYVASSTGNFFKNITSAGKNARKNKKLESEIASLNDQIRMLEGYKSENDRLRALIDLKETRTDFETVGANVIGRKIDEFNSIITLDKGKKDGVGVNDVVLVPEGLVGVVFEVNYNFCKVKTIFDTKTSVSAVCLRSGDMGIVEPTGLSDSNGKCNMNYIDRSAKTVVGDVIDTSGTGGIFPRGIRIGKITEIKEDSRHLTLTAVIETDIDIYKLDTVLIGKCVE